MTSDARAFYEGTFLPRYTEMLRQVLQTPLTVLIWGPGKGGGDLYSKRLQIRGQLRESGITAIFSEEVEVANPFSSYSAKALELCQALAADFIVVLQSSIGSTAEVHDFSQFVADVGRKMLIFIDSRAKDGYSYTGALQELTMLYNNVETYEYPRDIHECHLLAKVEGKIKVLQFAKWRQRYS